jgi:hypothetical protein
LWAPEAAELHINVKDFLALLWVLYLGVQEAGLANCIVDAYVDSSVLLGLLHGDWRGSPSPALNLCLLFLWFLQCSFGFELRPHWIPSEENQAADELSRLPDTYEYMLSRRLWLLVQRAFGPHALDLMSSAALTHKSVDGRRLPFVSRFASPAAVSYDVFRASLSRPWCCLFRSSAAAADYAAACTPSRAASRLHGGGAAAGRRAMVAFPR